MTPAYTFTTLPGTPLPAYRVTGPGLPRSGVTVIRSPRSGRWVAAWSRYPGPRGTRHAFGATREQAAAAAVGGAE